jgi:Gluconate 2-dehydrogenase subunit 3
MSQENRLSLDRRDLIKHMIMACGLALSASSLNALADSLLKPTNLARSKLKLLSADQLQLLGEVGEVIIPATDTPGAIAAGVHDFINSFGAHCLNKQEQEKLTQTLNNIGQASVQLQKLSFDKLDLNKKIELLTKIEQAKSPFSEQDRKDFKQLKSLIVFAYYTSEIGASKELAYLPLPGGYKGNFKFSTIGKAWAVSQ